MDYIYPGYWTIALSVSVVAIIGVILYLMIRVGMISFSRISYFKQ